MNTPLNTWPQCIDMGINKIYYKLRKWIVATTLFGIMMKMAGILYPLQGYDTMLQALYLIL